MVCVLLLLVGFCVCGLRVRMLWFYYLVCYEFVQVVSDLIVVGVFCLMLVVVLVGMLLVVACDCVFCVLIIPGL